MWSLITPEHRFEEATAGTNVMEEDKFQYPGSHTHKNIVYHGGMPEHILDKIDQEVTFPRDMVVVATYPKSGTTWGLEIVCQIHCLKSGKERPTNLSDAYPFIEVGRPGEKPQLETALENKDLTGVKTHLDSSYFARMLANPENCPKFLVVARNPKDTLVSFYHFHRSLASMNYSKPFNAFFEIFRSGELLYGSSIDNVLSWWKYKDHPRVHFIKYEDMLKDPLRYIKDIGDFLGVPLSEEQAENVRDASSITTMRSRGVEAYHKNAEIFQEQKSPFFRKGVKGDWRSYFTQEQSEYVDKLVAEKWAPVGLCFDE